MRRFFSVFLVSLILLASFSPAISVNALELDEATVNAQSEIIANEVRDTISKIAALRTQNALAEAEGSDQEKRNSNISNNTIESLEENLYKLGVTKLTDAEVSQMFSNNTASSRVITVPPSTSTVNWYMHGSYYLFEGVRYYVKQLYAQGLGSGSSLCGGADGVRLYTKNELLIREGIKVLSVAAELTQGLLEDVHPLISFLPTDYSFLIGDDVTNYDTRATYRYSTTVCFCYVREATANEDTEDLYFTSTSVNFSGFTYIAGWKNGDAFTSPDAPFDFTEHSMNYTSREMACKAFKYNNSDRRSYVESFSFYDDTDTKKHTVRFPTPSARIDVY